MTVESDIMNLLAADAEEVVAFGNRLVEAVVGKDVSLDAEQSAAVIALYGVAYASGVASAADTQRSKVLRDIQTNFGGYR